MEEMVLLMDEEVYSEGAPWIVGPCISGYFPFLVADTFLKSILLPKASDIR